MKLSSWFFGMFVVFALLTAQLFFTGKDNVIASATICLILGVAHSVEQVREEIKELGKK